jgi:pyruvate carboxylase
MPGLVVRVPVEEGDAVAAGQKLVLLEAMKMETTVYAERPGVVAELLVQAGTQVEPSDLRFRFEG